MIHGLDIQQDDDSAPLSSLQSCMTHPWQKHAFQCSKCLEQDVLTAQLRAQRSQPNF